MIAFEAESHDSQKLSGLEIFWSRPRVRDRGFGRQNTAGDDRWRDEFTLLQFDLVGRTMKKVVVDEKEVELTEQISLNYWDYGMTGSSVI